MKRSTIIGIIIIAAALIALAAWALLRGYDLEDAIDRYESGGYLAAIEILARLQRTADYEAGEKIYSFSPWITRPWAGMQLIFWL